MKTAKKALLFTLLLALLVAIMLPIGVAAYADDGTTDDTTITEETTEPTLEDFFNKYLVPIVGGSAASAIGIGLAILIPFVKKSNAYKQAVTGYKVVKSELESSKALIDELKEQVKNTDVNALVDKVTTTVSTVVMDKIGDIVKEEMDKRSDQTTSILTNVNTMSAQLANLISAATVTWSTVEGVPQLLAKSPTAAALSALEEENTALKTLAVQQLGVTQEDLQKMLSA